MDEVELSQGEVRSRGRLEGAGIRWERNPYIEVVELQLGQGVIKSSLDILWGVLVIPQLGGDEDVLSLQAGNISECALDALADFLLVAVDLGQVKVTVADLESLIDTVADLAGSGLPGAVPNTGDGMARVESDGLAEGHFAGFWGGISCRFLATWRGDEGRRNQRLQIKRGGGGGTSGGGLGSVGEGSWHESTRARVGTAP